MNIEALDRFLNLLEDHQHSLFELEICKTSCVAQQFNANDALTAVRCLHSFILFLVHVQQFAEFYTLNANTLRFEMITFFFLIFFFFESSVPYFCRLKSILEEILRKSLKINRHLLSLELVLEKRIQLYTQLAEFFKQLGSFRPHLIEKILINYFPLLEPAVDHMENEITEGSDDN